MPEVEISLSLGFTPRLVVGLEVFEKKFGQAYSNTGDVNWLALSSVHWDSVPRGDKPSAAFFERGANCRKVC